MKVNKIGLKLFIMLCCCLKYIQKKKIINEFYYVRKD